MTVGYILCPTYRAGYGQGTIPVGTPDKAEIVSREDMLETAVRAVEAAADDDLDALATA